MKLNRASYTWEKDASIDDIWEYTEGELGSPLICESYPNGCTWTCCGQPGGRPGCQWRRHKAYNEDTDDSDDSNDESDEVDGIGESSESGESGEKDVIGSIEGSV
ncbi:hypothetical protein QBC45DRAFT_445772 [Copromyces sp. CBS 386.78]|nr:hypothetical protein QBC45DRAFT_445772 [Copromyces sp. CBS 386.78]